ncbi:MAG TPA: SDR family oxidoreductase [Anaerolineales bacterium]|nr:SDR family oxidoreductase [Anaerolineales bacterium]
MADDVFEAFSLDGRVAVVTGGAGLLGTGFCRTLAAAGASVAVLDMDHDRAEHVAGSIRSQGRSALAVGADVTAPGSLREAAARIQAELGEVEILVNSAAKDPKFDPAHRESAANDFEGFSLEIWDEALKVNLTGAFLAAQVFAPAMLRHGKGSIVNICSTYGLVGPDQRIYAREGQAPQFKPVYYSVTKAGILGFTRYLATYYAGKNIRVNALTPGGVFADHDPDFVARYSARTVLGRMAEQGEMDAALLFLASDASSYMTGSNLVVDGGWTAW